jgi:hypothetical protein
MTKSITNSKTLKPQLSSEKIPQFYFPQGKPLDAASDTATKNAINAIFGSKNEVEGELCKKLVTTIIGLPNYFSVCLLSKCSNPKRITRVEFARLWK